ncbi:hypothetical protein CTI12_AA053580 [Artemisia annua]|uniref:Uncharacterized protein n=1 Tax=Artemisia annua TaxID=35608 RepID=A0A2U1QAK2_ARTAN|nr:hypothetical protein CTI12_AA053580 [Artemisia annua]
MGSSSPVVDELITKLKSSILSSIDTQNVTKALLDSEQRLKNQNLDLIKKTQVLEMENKKLGDLLKKKDKRIESLKKKNEELKDEMKEMVEENEGLKTKVEEMKKVYEKRVLDLEKLGKELMDWADFSGKRKEGVVGCAAETNIPQMSNEKRESKQGTDDKFPDTIPIDDDDENGDNDEDNLKCVPSSKRQRGSSEIKREYDSDDDRFISILRRKPVTKEIPSEYNLSFSKSILGFGFR